MRQGKKIHAVKAWREATGVSLADAKRAVEQVEAGGAPSWTPVDRAPHLLGPELIVAVRELKRRGRTIEAIKLMRQQTGLGLREAKEAVDNL
jgi:ribosomal protein L7/L12